ncbi:MAG: glycosyltransferase family 2 protein [Verrucomicrobia bacterium]|jgi:cellulose synthase/poly-beta-1,6-N-acetylglucosamine synthase-like glycosyltransferase|nr:glycosyltransferase family 2 protein [Verrucomicrobiota bacterium]
MSDLGVSLIISTYDQPEYLDRVLAAVSAQSVHPAEVLVADDGSGEATEKLFCRWQEAQPFRCERVWQPHEGFRKARILNAAIASATAPYCVLLDGDTVPHPRFIGDHAMLARPGYFVQGHRAMIGRVGARFFGLESFRRDRWRALVAFQVGGLKHAFRWPFPLQRVRTDLRGVRGCNLAVWRADLEKVNGYNEDFVGWGREDSELVVRLMNSGLRRLDVRGRALCYHLWHPPASRARLADNDDLLERAVRERRQRCATGLDAHLRRAGCGSDASKQ